ncbi:hypothetical protein GW575_00975 [Campylobacter sp. MIT 19-121]|nr:hypothetical protein [Campylobacter sp. MIT 19-121]
MLNASGWGGGLEFYNLALGANDSLQKLFAIKQYANIIKNTEYIIIETNINDYDMFHWGFSLDIIARNFEFLCKSLANLQVKVLFLILPLKVFNNADEKKLKIITQLIRLKVKQYNFNLIDMQKYYLNKDLNSFFATSDPYHQLGTIMKVLGQNIIKNLAFLKQNVLSQNWELPNFVIATPKEIFDCPEKLPMKYIKNSFIEQSIYKVDEKTKLHFNQNFQKYHILGMSIWNAFEGLENENTFSSYIIENKSNKIVKNIKGQYCFFHSLESQFKIDEQSYLYFNVDNEKSTEPSVWLLRNFKPNLNIKYCGLVHFFLANSMENFHQEQIDFNALAEEDIQIPKEYNFDHLIPPIELYKEIIDEYCTRMDPIKLAPLQAQMNDFLNSKLQHLNQEKEQLATQIHSLPHQKQIQELENLKFDTNIKKLQIKKLEKELGLKLSELEPKLIITQDELNSAKARVHKHLAYKLGQALIINSKSLLGYLRMPFILSYIKAQHHFELKKYQNAIAKNPNLKLPPLENYADYKEALQEKQCLTYKLGLALMQADKTWYKGGYVKFYFESKRLKREFKGKG